MKAVYVIFFTLFLGVFHSCNKEEVVFNAEANRYLELPTILKINGKKCCYDYIEKSLRYPIAVDAVNNFSPFIEFQEYSTVYFEGEILTNNNINNLGKIEINKEYSVRIETPKEIQVFSLTFTNIPIAQIITPNKVFDEPKTIAKIIVNYPGDNKNTDEYFIGLEYRGATSQSYEKKSYGFSLKASIDLNDDISGSFFDLKNNNDWILDAMWIDKARLRNKISFELWKKFDGDRHYGISANHVELYLNNEHKGLYCLSDNINAEFLNLNNKQAVLYKATAWEDGSTRFETYTNDLPLNYYWDGWEQKHPDPRIFINWQPLDEIRNLVVNENDVSFSSQIESLIDLNNLVDYYIFLNIVSAMDNTGKNTFLVKEGAGRFYIVPWDIDGSWGLFWDGTYTSYTSSLSNNLFDRLITTNTENFRYRLKQRWAYLRGNILSNTELENMFTNNFIKNSDIIDIENKKWGSNIDINSEQDYLIDWTINRVNFLDNYFDNL